MSSPPVGSDLEAAAATIAGMDEASGLPELLATAITVGAETEADLAAVVAPEGPVTEPPQGIGGIGRFGSLVGLGGRWRTASDRPVSGDQLRRLGHRLDDFAVTLPPLVPHVDSAPFTEQTAEAARWSARLWDDAITPTEALNLVRATLATLHRFRVNLLLQRPIDQT